MLLGTVPTERIIESEKNNCTQKLKEKKNYELHGGFG